MGDEIEITQRVRPTRVGMLIRADDPNQFVRACEANTTLWGGLLNPIFPYSRETEIETAAMFRAFQPEHVHLLTALPPTSDLQTIINNSSLPYTTSLTEEGTEFASRFITSARAIAASRGSEVHPGLAIYRWSPEHPFNLFNHAQLGCFRAPTEAHLQRLITDRLWYETVHIDEEHLPSQYMRIEMYSPVGLTVRHLHHRLPQHVPSRTGIFVGNPEDVVDLTDFWNLRALVYTELRFCPLDDTDLIPRLVKELPHLLRTDLRPPARSSTPVLHLDLFVGRSYEESLNEVVDAVDDRLPNDIVLLPQLMSPAVWLDDDLRGASYWLQERREHRPLNDRTVHFHTLRPEFLEETAYRAEAFTVDIEMSAWGRQDLVTMLPSEPGVEAALYWWTYQDERARIRPPVLSLIRGELDVSTHLVVPTAMEIIDSVLGGERGSFRISDAGAVLQAVVDRLGGVRECGMFRLAAVRNAVEHLSRGAPLPAGEMRRVIQTALKQRPPTLDAGHRWRRGIDNLSFEVIMEWLAARRVMRPGLCLSCTSCHCSDWYALSELGDTFSCKQCFHSEPVTTPHLQRWHFKADGLFQARNQKGCVAVALTLWRFLHGLDARANTAYVPSFKITFENQECEFDFGLVRWDPAWGRHWLLVGEVLGRDGKGANDINKLSRVISASPHMYIAVATLGDSFAEEELEALRRLRQRSDRLIVLGIDELESSDDEGPTWLTGWERVAWVTQAKYLHPEG